MKHWPPAARSDHSPMRAISQDVWVWTCGSNDSHVLQSMRGTRVGSVRTCFSPYGGSRVRFLCRPLANRRPARLGRCSSQAAFSLAEATGAATTTYLLDDVAIAQPPVGECLAGGPSVQHEHSLIGGCVRQHSKCGVHHLVWRLIGAPVARESHCERPASCAGSERFAKAERSSTC